MATKVQINNFNLREDRVTTERQGNTTITSRTTDRQVGTSKKVEILPTIRSREIHFRARGLMPNTRHFPYFDNVRVDKYCYPNEDTGQTSTGNWRWSRRKEGWAKTSRFSLTKTQNRYNDSRFRPIVQNDHTHTWYELYGNTDPALSNPVDQPDFPGALYSDANGEINGVFVIPNNTGISFPVGKRKFTLYDTAQRADITDELRRRRSTSYASAWYVAHGSNVTITHQIERTETTTVTTVVPPQDNELRQIDPIAQTFFVNDQTGVWVTSIDLFFQQKPSASQPQHPVFLQIRPVVNGYPSATEYLPGAEVWLTPDDVTTSATALDATTFTFDAPVKLNGNTEYAIVCGSNSQQYNVWISKLGDYANPTQTAGAQLKKKITKQPVMGSFFKSQNASVWEPSQFEDLKYTIKRAVFASAGTAIFENDEPQESLLVNNPMLFDSASTTVRVIHPNHGFFVNDPVKLYFDSSETLPVSYPNTLLKEQTITAVDYTGYTFTIDSAATSSGRFGGTAVHVAEQVLMDRMVPVFDKLTDSKTTVKFYGKFTTGKSLAGTETPYGKDTSYGDVIKPYEKKFFDAPRLIANYTNEQTQIGANSVTIKADLTSSDDRCTPIIDVDAMSILGISNVIDKQDSSATVGYNVPLTWIPETHPTKGSAVAKHVTRVVTLQDEAVGLKALLAANKPQQCSFDLYYKAMKEEDDPTEVSWTLVEPEASVPDATDAMTYRQYEYLIGGIGGTMSPFIKYQFKIVMHSTNSAIIPSFQDLRLIALSV